jgi:acetyl-CoA/propionyl-CoA carboxylase biotin carboxyl carrier protein
MLAHPDFLAATHSTRWVEEALDLSGLQVAGPDAALPAEAGGETRELQIEVDGRRHQVRVWAPPGGGRPVAPSGAATAPRPRPRVAGTSRGQRAAAPGEHRITAPMQGTVVRVLVEVGQRVEVGQPICVLEAMKMENQVVANQAGVVSELRVSEGSTVANGDVVAVIT